MTLLTFGLGGPAHALLTFGLGGSSEEPATPYVPTWFTVLIEDL
jgi:hypothetical protein